MQSHSADRPAARLSRAPAAVVICVVSLVLSIQGGTDQGQGALIVVPDAATGALAGPTVESFLTSHLFHPNGLGLITNCLLLLLLGGLLEARWGTARFLVFYFLCAWGGTAATIVCASVFQIAGCSFGASSVAMGVLAAAGVTLPAGNVRWLPPNRLLVWVGIFAGAALLAWVKAPTLTGPDGQALDPFLLPQSFGVPLALVFTWVLPRHDMWRLRRRELQEERRRQQVREIRRRVDHLLEKISAQGYDSLSHDELSFLRSASKHFRDPD